jgi:hypothetical protein
MLSLRRSKVLAALGLILTLAVATLACVTTTSQAQGSQAQASSSAIGPWSDSLAEYGMPSAPTLWNPSNFDVQIHTRGMQSSSGNDAHLADHGADCSAPPATHPVSSWQQAVFICHQHVMTTISDGGFGEIVLTPDHLADWSNGPVTIKFSVSTFRTDPRDWISVDLTPFSDQLALPLPANYGEVDLQGTPRNLVEFKTDAIGSQTKWVASEAVNSFRPTGVAEEVQGFNSATGIVDSKTIRTPFELTISRTEYSLKVGAGSAVGAGKTLLQGTFPTPLPFTQSVVQFSQIAYDPEKCDTGAMDASSCQANTWHWSDFAISNAVPYTLLRPTSQVISAPGGAITFAQGAPAGSFLKFAAIGNVQVSYDGGKTYSAAQTPPMDAGLFHEEHFTSYLTPVPPGTREAQLTVAGGWYGPGMARDFSIVGLTTNGGPPATQPPGSQPTATQPSSSTPIPLNNTPCMVQVNGAMQNGTCSGSFSPSK